MNAAEAHAAAAAEGLALVRAENPTGFKGVSHDQRPAQSRKPFKAQLRHDGCTNHLGTFATAEEAALAVARFLGPEGVAAEQAAVRDSIGRKLPAASQRSAAPMTAAEAYTAAAAEGLALLGADNETGFKGVKRNTSNTSTISFKAQLMRGGRTIYLGIFATAEEAALAVARFLGPEGVVASLAAAASAALEPAPMTAAEAHAAAAAEGLALLCAENSTGFKDVRRSGKSSGSKPFTAELRHGGRKNYLGAFATAEEAALAVARFLGPEGVTAALAPEPAPMTAEEAHAAAAAEGLTLLRAENTTGFKNVSRKTAVEVKLSKPFKAQLNHGGRNHHLGHFATAEQAALAVARFLAPPAAEAAPAAPPAAPLAPAAATQTVTAPTADAAPPDTSGVEVTGEVRRDERERRKRKRAIDVDALELEVKVEVKEEPL